MSIRDKARPVDVKTFCDIESEKFLRLARQSLDFGETLGAASFYEWAALNAAKHFKERAHAAAEKAYNLYLKDAEENKAPWIYELAARVAREHKLTEKEPKFAAKMARDLYFENALNDQRRGQNPEMNFSSAGKIAHEFDLFLRME